MLTASGGPENRREPRERAFKRPYPNDPVANNNLPRFLPISCAALSEGRGCLWFAPRIIPRLPSGPAESGTFGGPCRFTAPSSLGKHRERPNLYGKMVHREGTRPSMPAPMRG
ncbi:hypothetical protein [Azospirillum endophyticum]